MSNLIDMVGQTFGRLTVLKRATDKEYHEANWVCKCSCGNETIVYGSSLRSGKTKSCGCIPRWNKLPEGEASFNNLYKVYLLSAAKRNLEFALTKEQVRKLTKENCHYCGSKPLGLHKATHRINGNYIYNGIDRIDNNKGYTIDNVVACCQDCNYAKGTKTRKEFLAWARRVVKHNPTEG